MFVTKSELPEPVIVRDSVSDVRVIERLGFGLDEKAVETIRTWRFKPALRDGRPVSMRIHEGLIPTALRKVRLSSLREVDVKGVNVAAAQDEGSQGRAIGSEADQGKGHCVCADELSQACYGLHPMATNTSAIDRLLDAPSEVLKVDVLAIARPESAVE